MVMSCKLSKKPNGCGNYSCQYFEDGHFKVCTFKSYEDGVSYAYLEWSLTSVLQDLQNSIVLGR